MAIVDFTYYYNVYLGQEADQTTFPALEARSEDLIGAMTRWQATDETIATLPPFIQTLVKKAICAQVDWFAVNGLDSLSESGGASNGFTVGKVSIHTRTGNQNMQKTGAMAESVAPLVLSYLEQTGLMNPQVITGPDMPLIGRWL